MLYVFGTNNIIYTSKTRRIIYIHRGGGEENEITLTN